MKIEVNIEKRHAFGIIGAIFVLAIVIGVGAYGTSTPPAFGHSAEELEVSLAGELVSLQNYVENVTSRIDNLSLELQDSSSNGCRMLDEGTWPNEPGVDFIPEECYDSFCDLILESYAVTNPAGFRDFAQGTFRYDPSLDEFFKINQDEDVSTINTNDQPNSRLEVSTDIGGYPNYDNYVYVDGLSQATTSKIWVCSV